MLPIYLLLGVFLFSIGIFLFLTRRNIIMMLMGIELMLNAANINFVAFARVDTNHEGQMAAIFVIVLAAAEMVVALALVLQIFRYFHTLNMDEITRLKN